MTRLTAFLLSSASAAALFTASGCVADTGDEGMYISKAVAPGADCTFTSQESEAFIGRGSYKIGAPYAYTIIPQVKSKITAADKLVNARTVQIRGARVDLTFADEAVGAGLDSSLTKFQTLFSAPLAPNGGVTDAIFDLIPAGLSQALAEKYRDQDVQVEVLAKLQVYGDMSGKEVVSQDFQFPVTMCTNCITFDLGACSTLTAETPVRSGNSCNPFQDGVVDCCTDGTRFLCPAPIPTN